MYTRDDHAHTRGVGAVAATDGRSQTARAHKLATLRASQAREAARVAAVRGALGKISTHEQEGGGGGRVSTRPGSITPTTVKYPGMPGRVPTRAQPPIPPKPPARPPVISPPIVVSHRPPAPPRALPMPPRPIKTFPAPPRFPAPTTRPPIITGPLSRTQVKPPPVTVVKPPIKTAPAPESGAPGIPPQSTPSGGGGGGGGGWSPSSSSSDAGLPPAPEQAPEDTAETAPEATATPPKKPNLLLYAGLAAGLYFLLRDKKGS
jgi:hypothetical protein